MTETHGTTASGDEQQQQQNQIDTLPGAPTDAFGCGATGCVSNDRLRKMTDGSGRRRVLCADCARRFASEGTA